MSEQQPEQNVIDHSTIDPKSKIQNKLNNLKSQRNKKPIKSHIDVMDSVKGMIIDVHENKEYLKLENGVDQRNYLKKLYPNLFKDYLPIFTAVYNKELKTNNDINMLGMMLSQKRLIDKNRKSEYKASAQVGQLLFDKFAKGKF